MEDGKPPCNMGLQTKLSQITDGTPPSTGSEAFKMISPVDVRFTSGLASSFKKPSFVNHCGDHSSSIGAVRQLFLEPSHGKLAGNPDSWNKQMILYQPSDKAPFSGNGGVVTSSTSSPLKSDQPGNETRSKWDRNLNNSNMDPRKLRRCPSRFFFFSSFFPLYLLLLSIVQFVELVPFLYWFQLSLSQFLSLIVSGDCVIFLLGCRILSNRLSAQKSRLKKFHYIDEMERKVKALEVTNISLSLYTLISFTLFNSWPGYSKPETMTNSWFPYKKAEIGLITPQIAVQEHQVELLKMENTFLNQKLASIEEKNVIKDGRPKCNPPLSSTHIYKHCWSARKNKWSFIFSAAVVEQKRDEVRRLKEIYRLQQQEAQVRGMFSWKAGLMWWKDSSRAGANRDWSCCTPVVLYSCCWFFLCFLGLRTYIYIYK